MILASLADGARAEVIISRFCNNLGSYGNYGWVAFYVV
jgi:hypothetical protein